MSLIENIRMHQYAHYGDFKYLLFCLRNVLQLTDNQAYNYFELRDSIREMQYLFKGSSIEETYDAFLSNYSRAYTPEYFTIYEICIKTSYQEYTNSTLVILTIHFNAQYKHTKEAGEYSIRAHIRMYNSKNFNHLMFSIKNYAYITTIYCGDLNEVKWR